MPAKQEALSQVVLGDHRPGDRELECAVTAFMSEWHLRI